MSRLSRLRSQMKEAGAKSLLLTSPVSLRYLFGLSDLRWALITADRSAVMPFKLGEDAARAAIGPPVKLLDSGKGMELIPSILGGKGGMRLHFEGSTITFETYRSAVRVLGSRVLLVPSAGIVERTRETKSADEIRAVRKAGWIASTALDMLLDFAKPGMSERRIAVFLDVTMRSLGADGPAFETIVLSGARSAYPHGTPSERRIRRGDLLLLDFGAKFKGYCSDITRVFAVSKGTPRQQRIYAAVFRAYRTGKNALRSGCVCGRPHDASARALGPLSRRFIHGLGHGVGLEIHEGPRLASGQTQKLAAGHVVTVEPGVYFPGWGGIRLEDSFLVQRNGASSLTGAPASHLPLIS